MRNTYDTEDKKYDIFCHGLKKNDPGNKELEKGGGNVLTNWNKKTKKAAGESKHAPCQ